jgi:raffinose/stachyose/melibiose transport system permease protein
VTGRALRKTLFTLVVLAFVGMQLYPIAWLFMASVKPTVELSSRPFALPQVLTLENYHRVLGDGKLGGYMWNSVKVTGISLLLIMALGSTTGYALSKFRYKISSKIYAFFTFGIMIPVQITLIPLFIFYSRAGILDTAAALILPQVGFALPLSAMLFVNFYAFVPNDLIEAAIIDGSTPYGIFFKIMVPLARNTFITVASMYSILIWNDFIFANTFSADAAKTVAVGLKDYVGAYGHVDWGATFAAIVLSVLPPMVVYFLLSKQVCAGMTVGATKG